MPEEPEVVEQEDAALKGATIGYIQVGDAKPQPVSVVTTTDTNSHAWIPANADFAEGLKQQEAEQEEARAERIWNRIKERLGWKSDGDEATGFKVAGNHWLAVWSNDFKDRDGEIFTRKAIDAYVSRVDMGITPLPELWVWHGGKDVAIGAADWVGRHGHFSMAAGQFYGGDAPQAAKAYYTKRAKDTGISHGYTYPADQLDGKHYSAFSTFED